MIRLGDRRTQLQDELAELARECGSISTREKPELHAYRIAHNADKIARLVAACAEIVDLIDETTTEGVEP